MDTIVKLIGFLAFAILSYVALLGNAWLFASSQDVFLKHQDQIYSRILFDVFNIIVLLAIVEILTVLFMRKAYFLTTHWVLIFLMLPAIQGLILVVLNKSQYHSFNSLFLSTVVSMSGVVVFFLIKELFKNRAVEKIPQKAYLLKVAAPTCALYAALELCFS